MILLISERKTNFIFRRKHLCKVLGYFELLMSEMQMNDTDLQRCYAVMTIQDPALTAEVKYFLIRVLFLYKCAPISKPIQDLANEIGISDVVLKKVRDLLVEKGYLVRMLKHSNTSVRGRPIEGFQIAMSFVEVLDDLAAQQNQRISYAHYKRLNRVLFWTFNIDDDYKIDNSQSRTKKMNLGDLRPVTRLVMAVLYFYADACGVVRDMGLTTISRKCCMTVQRLELQLTALQESGYILYRVSGLTGTVLFGKSSGAIFLNVFDNALLVRDGSAALIMQQTKFIDCYNDNFLAWRIFGVLNKNSIYITPNPSAWKSNETLGVREATRSARAALQRIKYLLENEA